jgi:lipopolysaccharide biosynthesis glycosyltransferase
MNKLHYNLLVTLNSGYLKPLSVMLKSAVLSNPEADFSVYILHSSLSNRDFDHLIKAIESDQITLHPIFMDDSMLKSAPTSGRYPAEMYYRLFASRYLPENLDRILYLDPDLVIINSLETLYALPLENHYFVACSHIVIMGLQRINELRLNMAKDTPYINSGVLLMNLTMLRKEMDPGMVLEYIRKHKKVLMLPDQDVLSALYGSKTLLVDSLRYNLSERFLRDTNLRLFPGGEKVDLEWIRQHSVIVHYCGRNKPWKPRYSGSLGVFYQEVAEKVTF